MSPRRFWITLAAGGTLALGGFAALIWFQHKSIAESRVELEALSGQIQSSRKLIEGTAALEREVIVLREVSEVMKEILPDNDDVNNLVRTLQRFSDDSGLRTSGLKKKSTTVNARDKTDFDQVGYTLTLEGDAFAFLKFLDFVETHSRFMRVPSFRLTAANRRDIEKEGTPAHKVTVDVETFVYEPKKDSQPVRIDGFERKRDLLLGEVNRRRQELTLATYTYRGQRGRRDPWIDPRVPVQGEGESALSVQAQMDLVQGLYDRVQVVLTKWEQVKTAENVIVEMMTRAELDEDLSQLEEDVRRTQAEKTVQYVPSLRRLQIEVADVVAHLRTELSKDAVGRGPTENQLKQIEESMLAHRERAEYKLMLEAYAAIESQLALAGADPLRKPLVERLIELAHEARTVQEFQKIKMNVGGLALQGEDALVLINGRTLGVGDMFDNEVVIRSITAEEIEFLFRGIVFARRF